MRVSLPLFRPTRPATRRKRPGLTAVDAGQPGGDPTIPTRRMEDSGA
jgi:hypothetical protein